MLRGLGSRRGALAIRADSARLNWWLDSCGMRIEKQYRAGVITKLIVKSIAWRWALDAE